MNNYIDERLVKQNAAKLTANRYIRVKNGRPLNRSVCKESLFVELLKVVAAIFLLIISTFGGDEAKSGTTVEKMVKNGLLGAGVLLALWGVLVVMSNLMNVVTLVPTWCLILGFAAVVLGAVALSKR
ncbi:MAG: hypothetical protein IKU48_02090 [Clostridia bacterium]|nr:hypothetical protein [Clostridia bacterium]